MKVLTDSKTKVFFCKVLLCAAVFSLLAAVLLNSAFQNATLLLVAAVFCMTFTILFLCWQYLNEREQMLEDAASQIAEYILDNRQDHMECNAEGAMYHLFHEVNSLVAIVNAHTDSERKTKEFLQNTITDISHQLKTPIAALNIYNGILQQEAEDASTVRKFAVFSEQELDRIETLVQNLLKIAKLDAGAITLEQRPEKLSELLESVVSSFAFRAEKEGKDILLRGEPAVLICDRVWFKEAISNIVKNALDHTTRGDCIQIRWEQSPTLVQIVIEDNGSGIHPEDLYHIFKRFYRSRFSADTQGIGLGLSLARAIIEAHKGNIEVSSQLGVGTIFTIYFLNPTKL